jgi:hypothetical protein
MAKPPLRAVSPSERAPQRKKRLTVTQAAKADSHRELLAALRDRLAAAVENPNCNDVALAALSRQISLISKELSIMDTEASEDSIAVAAGTPDEDWSAV